MIRPPSQSDVLLALVPALLKRSVANPSAALACGITYRGTAPLYWVEAREDVRSMVAEIISGLIRRTLPVKRRWMLNAEEAIALVSPTARALPSLTAAAPLDGPQPRRPEWAVRKLH
jgi:hypothetical protein